MRVLAISDLHLDYEQNRAALRSLPDHRDDWLLLGGDVGHRIEHLEEALAVLVPRFRRLIWTPGNHDLWERPGEGGLEGQTKYQRLVAVCQRAGVLTPEDPYASLLVDGVSYVVAPVFVLYDYTFRPDSVPLEDAVSWAMEEGIVCLDEHLLSPAPYPSRGAWCAARCELTEHRLAAVARSDRLVLLNHFPLRRDLVHIRIPRFLPWCGTRRTEDWHTRFNVAVVVSGHLHVRRTDWRDGVRFEEVSLGYPRQWRSATEIDGYLRQILPPPAAAPSGYHL